MKNVIKYIMKKNDDFDIINYFTLNSTSSQNTCMYWFKNDITKKIIEFFEIENEPF